MFRILFNYMWNYIKVWVQNRYFQIINSIAFYPGLIGLSFLLLAALAISFDYSKVATEIKGNTEWLSIQDASTARSIISAIAARSEEHTSELQSPS